MTTTRKPDGMSVAISMHGSRDLSKRAKRANERILTRAIWGTEHVTREMIVGKAREMSVSEQVAHLRSLAGMASGAQAKVLLRQAAELEASVINDDATSPATTPTTNHLTT